VIPGRCTGLTWQGLGLGCGPHAYPHANAIADRGAGYGLP
jgi:hypothetical protein